jgi:hypothetical protein
VTRIDQFASVFRAASKERFTLSPIAVRDVLVVTDLEDEAAGRYKARASAFLGALPGIDDRTIRHVAGPRTEEVGALLDLVQEASPDLIVTYRNLHTRAWRWPYTLGDHVEILTQVCTVPILLLPRFDAGEAPEEGFTPPAVVMAMTDHLAGDDTIVNWTIAMTGKGDGRRVVLAHVEDEVVFERYMDLIGKTPNLDTDVARRDLAELLLKEPREYTESVSAALREAGHDLRVEPAVTFGAHLSTYRRLVSEHDVDLLVLHTKDEDQLAMHGAAYPLVVELRRIPMLLL